MQFWLQWSIAAALFTRTLFRRGEDYSRGDILRRRQPAIACPRHRSPPSYNTIARHVIHYIT